LIDDLMWSEQLVLAMHRGGSRNRGFGKELQETKM
jgi:hypothetical protein